MLPTLWSLDEGLRVLPIAAPYNGHSWSERHENVHAPAGSRRLRGYCEDTVQRKGSGAHTTSFKVKWSTFCSALSRFSIPVCW
jgi:hypothetical protein